MTVQNIAGTINTGSAPRLLWPGVKTIWGLNYSEQDAYYRKLYDIKDSDKAWELSVEESGFGLAPVKPEGEPVKYDSAKTLGDVKTRNVAYSLGYVITKEAIEDNLYGNQVEKFTRALAKSMMATKEYKGALKFANNDTVADGQNLFSTSHGAIPGTQANILTTPAALSMASVEDVLIMISEAKDNRGKPILLKAKGLVVAPKNYFRALKITNSFLDPDTAGSNAANPLFEYFKDGTVSNPYFAGFNDDIWFVKTDADDAFVHYVRKPIEISRDDEFDTENLKVKAYERYSYALNDWRGAFAGKI